MLSRRAFSTALLTTLAAPLVSRAAAQTASDMGSLAGELPQLHAIMVQRGEDIVLAEAFRGPGLDRVANIKSCSKSIVALLAGSAISQGAIAGVDATLGAVAPSIIPSDATPGAADLTIEDLVTLRAGLEGTSGGNYGAWVNSGNWVAFALRRPMVAAPGGRMIYSTGTTHILGAALAVATGDSLSSRRARFSAARLALRSPPGPVIRKASISVATRWR